MTTVTCKQCGHTWRARSAKPPRCKGCGTRRWAGDKPTATAARVATARVQLRAVIDDAVGEFDCLRCGHSWTGPRYRRCPACDRLRWWQPLRETHAQRRARERNEMHQAARDRTSTTLPTYATVRRAPQPNGDLIITTIERGTGNEDTRLIPWADLFDEADADYEAGVLDDHRAAVAAAEAVERERLAVAAAAEAERAAQAQRDLEAALERKRLDEEWLERERREAAAEADRQRVAAERARRTAERAAEWRLDQEWLHARWYRPLARLLGRVLYTVIVPAFYIVMLLVVIGALLFGLRQLQPHWQDWRTSPPEPTVAIATPTPREEDYLAAHQHALEQAEEWALHIERRIERNRPLPNGLDLAGARAQLAYWEERADGFASALQRYQ